MKKILFLMVEVSAGFNMPLYQYQNVSFTQQDSDRIRRLEEGQKAINERIDEGFKSANQRIDDLEQLVYIVLTGMFVLVGFNFWERRTTLASVVQKGKELEEREDKIEKILKKLATKNSRIAEVLKHIGLLRAKYLKAINNSTLVFVLNP